MGRRNLKRWIALGVVALVVVPTTVLVLLAEGFHATRINLNDAGIWVVNWQLGVAGRVNTQTGTIEVAVGATDPKAFDIAQADDVVYLNGPTEHTVASVDVALARVGDSVEVPEGEGAQLGGATGIVSDRASGKVWFSPRAALGQLDVSSAEPLLEVGRDAVTAVGVEGTAVAYAPGAAEVHVVGPDGERGTMPVPPIDGPVQITVVGSTPVLLDVDGKRVVVPDRPPVEVAGAEGGPVLQEPGPARAGVLVGTDDAMVEVALESGEQRELVDGGTGKAVRPVWVDGCAFAAWKSAPRYAQVCDGEDPISSDFERASPGATMRFRVNRNRVMLNDSATGVNLLFSDDEPKVVDDWEDALRRDEQEEEVEEEIEPTDPKACAAEASAMKLADDTRGTRPGRPILVPVLENDQFSRCDVPVVTVPEPPPAEEATVRVVEDATTVQVTPAADRTTPIEFAYQVVLAGRTETARVRVEVYPPDVNTAPVTVPDRTSVVAGNAVRHDVLANDYDPEGDALNLVSAVASSGAITFRADGEVSFTSSSSETGIQSITYVAQDDGGAQTEGTLSVTVSPADTNVPPEAENDRASTVVGREAVVDLLANDSDPNGQVLKVVSVSEPADLEIDWADTGQLRARPVQAGTWLFTYTISDGEKTSDANVRVDAIDPVENRAPVAVRDDLAARPGIPAYVDLVANDVDPDGDLLAVVGLDVDPESGLTVELLDKHIARVTAPAAFQRSSVVRYTVSDGDLDDRGALVVRPATTGGVDQPPIVAPDQITARAGSVSGIPVLENDLDPEGERLQLTKVGTLGPEEGRVFVEGDELRYEAPPNGPATVRVSYTVEDPGRNAADGAVTINVLPADAMNQPPRAPRLEARVFAGDETVVPVATMGLDPDGDLVSVVGVSEPPRKGHAILVPAGFSYRADRGATGTDTFSFTVRDALGAEATGTVRVAVVARPSTNSNPVAVPDRKGTTVGAPVTIAVLANDSDPDGDQLSLLTDGKDAPSRPRFGEVQVSPEGDALTYTPTGTPPGDISFSYTVADGRGGSSRGIVTVTVTEQPPANQKPIARDDIAPVQAPGATVEVDVLANDLDPDGDGAPLSVALLTSGVDASVLGDGKVRVTVGDRSVALVYEVTDSGGEKAQAVVAVPVSAPRPPVCETRTVEVKAGESISVPVLDACRDPEDHDLELVRVLAERGGSVRLDGSKVVFTAEPEVPGDGGFAFLVSNGATTAFGGVVVKVVGQDFPPDFADSAVQLPAGGTRTVDLAALVTDLNAEDTHRFEGLSGASDRISARIDGTTLQIEAADDARGATAALTFQVTDGPNTVDGRVDVQVLAHDGQPPIAVDDVDRTTQRVPKAVDVVANDVDPIGEGLTVGLVGQVVGGRAEVVGTSIRFTPNDDFFGEASMAYRIKDAADDEQRSSTATLRISVVGFPSKPSAPTGVRESGLVRLQWGAASPNGAPVTEYVIRTNTGLEKRSPSTSVVFDGLENGETYQFQVAAKNEAVKDEATDLQWSERSVGLMPNERPGIPAAPRLTFGDRSIRVQWAPPAVNNGTAITGYQVRISGQGANEVRPFGPTTTETNWTGLVNGRSYTFAVRAENEADWSEWSPTTNDPVNSIPAARPGIVPNVAAQRLDRDRTNGGWVTVTWGPPADNGDANFTFEITTTPADVPPVTITNPTQRSYEMGGLTNGTGYTFRITATNKAGEGDPGISPQATPAALPDRVAAVQATPGDSAANLSFTGPADNGEPIVEWQYRNNGGGWVTMNVNNVVQGPSQGAPLTATVSGFNGTESRYEVRSRNAVGWSDASPPSNPVVPFGRPAAPTVSAAVSGGTITWSWNEPNGNGRPISHYLLVLDGAQVSNNNTTRTFSRTFPLGESHRLDVFAINTEGTQGYVGSASASTALPIARQVTISDSFFNGTWARTGSNDGTWYPQGNRPPNGDRWLPNGRVVDVTCWRRDAVHEVRFVGQSQTENWNVWLRLTDGTWIAGAVAVEQTSNNPPPGIPGC